MQGEGLQGMFLSFGNIQQGILPGFHVHSFWGSEPARFSLPVGKDKSVGMVQYP